ncbi:MAG: NlpC/P60 family protein [Pseudomonadota bacterium]
MEAWDDLDPARKRDSIVSSAKAMAHSRRFAVGEHRFSTDCSGYVGAVLYRNGIDVFRGATELDIRGNGVRILHEFVIKYGRIFHDEAAPGDLVFFNNTYDRNRDRNLNDALTHIGIVSGVDSDGTVRFLHYMKGKVRKGVMNLQNPWLARDEEGNKVNDYMRRRKRSDRRGTPHTAAGLFADFGSLLVLRIDEPSPTPTPTAQPAPQPVETPPASPQDDE